MKDAGADRFFKGFCGFVSRSVFLGLGGLRLDLRHNGFGGSTCVKKSEPQLASGVL